MGLREDIDRLKLMGCDGVYTDELEVHLASEEADRTKKYPTSKKKKSVPVALRKKQKTQ